ncbi:hypothetical protein HAX54_017826 [Datura stramonium]|uniref:Uncharacterized protein n=1 Tax=Datura stramonium TaxID=4076 RepID=A0ABS8S177_DATST|nr:hypothetical protein [Datura stramonium]
MEKELATFDKGIEATEEKIESTVSFGELMQAEAVAEAELVGGLVANTIVNGFLGAGSIYLIVVDLVKKMCVSDGIEAKGDTHECSPEWVPHVLPRGQAPPCFTT